MGLALWAANGEGDVLPIAKITISPINDNKTYFNITNNLNFMIMKVEKEMKYEAPEVTVLEVEVELGFAASPQNPGMDEGGLE